MKRTLLTMSGLLMLALYASWTFAQKPAPDPAPTPDPAPAPAPTPPSAQGCPTAPDDMVCIPGGTFRMGSLVGDDDEQPLRTVTLGAFLMDRQEVSFSHYMQCVQAGRCDPPRYYPPEVPRKDSGETPAPATTQGKSAPTPEAHRGKPVPPPREEAAKPKVQVKISNLRVDGDLPVAGITWFDARNYCAFVQKHLPTEAQWELATRGTAGRYYAWGQEAPDCTRVNSETCGKAPKPVSALPAGATPEGILNLLGNVWEWVNDWYDGTHYAASQNATDPIGPINHANPATGRWHYRHRVIRGGSWSGIPADLRATYRYRLLPSMYASDIGFRCVRSSVPLERTAPQATPLPPTDAAPPSLGQ